MRLSKKHHALLAALGQAFINEPTRSSFFLDDVGMYLQFKIWKDRHNPDTYMPLHLRLKYLVQKNPRVTGSNVIPHLEMVKLSKELQAKGMLEFADQTNGWRVYLTRQGQDYLDNYRRNPPRTSWWNRLRPSLFPRTTTTPT